MIFYVQQNIWILADIRPTAPSDTSRTARNASPSSSISTTEYEIAPASDSTSSNGTSNEHTPTACHVSFSGLTIFHVDHFNFSNNFMLKTDQLKLALEHFPTA